MSAIKTKGGTSCSVPCSFQQEDLDKVLRGKILKSKCPMLQEVDLSGKDFKGQDFRGACLVKANLDSTEFTPSLLYGADLRHAKGGDMYGDIYNSPGRILSLPDPDGTVVHVLEEFRFSTLPMMKYRSRANKGEAFYQFVVALLLETFSTAKDHKKESLRYYEMAANQNHWPSINNLGWRYEHGYGVEQSLEKAYELYDKAAMHDSVASFNVLRFSSVYNFEITACYALAAKYRTGEAVPVDMELSFHWMKTAAKGSHTKACRYVGVMLRSGTGTKKNLPEALMYLERAADPTENGDGEKGDPEAQYELGVMYEFGYGTAADFSRARFWYQKAAERADHAEAYLHLGKLFEEGKGGEISFHDALSCYRKVSYQKRVTGMYNMARMLEHFPDEENSKLAVELYQKVLETDPFHAGALFLLGTHYQKGSGIPQDLDKAAKIYKESADNGHALAKIRQFMISVRGACCSDDLLSKEIDRRIFEAKERVEKELSKNYSIDSYAYLTTDFNVCMKIIDGYCSVKQGHGPFMNARLLPYDPYLKDMTLLEDVTPEERSNVDNVFETIKVAGAENPALTDDLLNGLQAVRDSVTYNDTLIERFLRLYKGWTSEERGLPVPDDVEDRLKYRQGLVAQKLVQNIGRCCDGVGTFFAEEEIGFSMDNSGLPVPIGIRLCSALSNYKFRFLQEYVADPNPDNYEYVTEGLALAIQRMRMPLGLPGVFTNLKYPSMGSRNRFNPEYLMTCFLFGAALGTVDGADWVSVKPYTVETVCQYLNEIIDNPEDKTLTKEHISDFVLQDPILKQAGEDAFIEFEENEYCNPFVDQNANPYKAKTLERILALHGYVVGHKP